MPPSLNMPISTTLGFTLEWSRLGLGALLVGFIVACVILILIILIQKPQGGGLSSAPAPATP
jgi:hypothetical protein